MKHDSGTASAGVGAPRRKSIIALISSFALLLVGLVGVIAAPAASAHNVSLQGAVTCEKANGVNTGKYVFTWTLPADPGYPASATASGAITDNTSKTLTATWSAVFNDGSSRTLNTYTTWKDGYDGNRNDSKTISADGPCNPPVKYTADKTVTGSLTVCSPSPGNGNTVVVNWSGTGHGESTVDQATADALALAQATTNANNDKTAKLNAVKPYTEGACSNTYSVTKTSDKATLCVDGTTIVVGPFDATVVIPAQQTPITDQQKADAATQAQAAADKKLADAVKAAGGTAGKCQNSYTVTKSSGKTTLCVDGTTTVVGPFDATVVIQPQETPITDKQKADAAAEAQAAADKKLADAVKAAGGTPGKCTATAQRSGEMTICADDPVNQPSVRAIETRNVAWSTAVYQAEGATTAEAQAAADALADAAVPAAKAAALAPYPNFTDGACKDTTTYGASRGASGSATICTADGKTVNVNWSGSAAVSGKNSQDEANTQAQNDANKAADADKAAKLAGFPGSTQGACVPPTTTSPVVAPQPATVPAPAKKPAKPVAAPKPATVPAGFAGTVPAAVPAGGGSSAPQSGFPTWAMLLIVAGAAGAAFSVKRLASQR